MNGRSALKKDLTEPTLLEMSGKPTNRDLDGSSGDNFRFNHPPRIHLLLLSKPRVRDLKRGLTCQYVRTYYTLYEQTLTSRSYSKAGLKVMFRSGYQGASVRDVCAAAGVPQGSFTNHFRSKEVFAQEVLDRYFANLQG